MLLDYLSSSKRVFRWTMRLSIRSASRPEILNRCTKRCAMSCALCACLILRSQVAALADDSASSQHLIPRPSSSATKSMLAKVRRSAWILLLTIAGLSAREMVDASQFYALKYCARAYAGRGSPKPYAISKPVREIMEAVLGPECFKVRGWRVVWHEDLRIDVRERREVNGFGPWTMKGGVLHVQPPPEVMSSILAIRPHLDESGIDNGHCA